MSTPFDFAIAAASGALQGVAGIAVTYRRGSGSVQVTAIRGQTDVEAMTDHSVIVADEMADWLISAADLVIDGATIEPRRGDTIEAVYGEQTVTFEVLPAGDKVFRYRDRARTMLRIHSKLKSKEN